MDEESDLIFHTWRRNGVNSPGVLLVAVPQGGPDLERAQAPNQGALCCMLQMQPLGGATDSMSVKKDPAQWLLLRSN